MEMDLHTVKGVDDGLARRLVSLPMPSLASWTTVPGSLTSGTALEAVVRDYSAPVTGFVGAWPLCGFPVYTGYFPSTICFDAPQSSFLDYFFFPFLYLILGLLEHYVSHPCVVFICCSCFYVSSVLEGVADG